MLHRAILVLMSVLLVGCATPISKSLTTDITGVSMTPHGPIAQGLLDAAYNFDQAVVVGALDATDPAPGCVHGVLKDLGIDPANPTTPPPSFVPRVSDLISAGSVLYIRVQQAKKGTGSVALPVDCEALIGKLVIDTAKLGIKVGSYFAPGLGLATGIATGVLPAIK